MPVAYRCKLCNYESAKRWTGPCPGRGCWSNIRTVNTDDPNAESAHIVDGDPMPLGDAVTTVREIPRIETGVHAIDCAVARHYDGGLGELESPGFARGGVYLFTGSPGSGKTTLLLQALQGAASLHEDVLYVSGEENTEQIARKAKPLGKMPARLMFVHESDLDRILDILDEHDSDMVVIDSAQTLVVAAEGHELEPGSAASIKIAIRMLSKFAKATETCVVLIGHVTKDGSISGPRALEHYVDVVMHLQSIGQSDRRELQVPYKNRFGEAGRRISMLMTGAGLVAALDDNPEPPVLRSVP
jgi:DNA repair protein RadA/Sms